MTKAEAIRLLGGTATEAGRRCRVTPQAISGWPDPLTPAIEDRVIAALARDRVPNLLDDARRDTSPAGPDAPALSAAA